MPIISNFVPTGTLIRYIGPAEGCEPALDTLAGAVYVVAGMVTGDIYYIDEVGDKNFSASPDGDGLFEIVEC